MQRDSIVLVSINLHELKCIWTVLVRGNCITSYVYTDYHRQATKMFRTTTSLFVHLSFAFTHLVSCQQPTTRWNLCLNTKFIKLHSYVRVFIIQYDLTGPDGAATSVELGVFTAEVLSWSKHILPTRRWCNNKMYFFSSSRSECRTVKYALRREATKYIIKYSRFNEFYTLHPTQKKIEA
jgi:hypothetical protein